MITPVPYFNFPDVQHLARPFLEDFASHDPDGMTADDFEAEIMDRNLQAWCIKDWQAFALTRVTRKSVRIVACAGVRADEWKSELDSTIREWAGKLGKDRVVSLARPGWSRWAKTQGYREAHREMILELTA